MNRMRIYLLLTFVEVAFIPIFLFISATGVNIAIQDLPKIYANSSYAFYVISVLSLIISGATFWTLYALISMKIALTSLKAKP
jgi:hypothetical protein